MIMPVVQWVVVIPDNKVETQEWIVGPFYNGGSAELWIKKHIPDKDCWIDEIYPPAIFLREVALEEL